MMKNKDSIIYGLMILCVVLISSCTDNKSNKSKDKIVSVKIKEVHADNVSLNSYIGTSEENISADISFLVSGNIREINVRESEKVKKGQKLASLDITNLNNSNNAAEAAYKQANDAYDRMKKLYDNGSLPEIKFIEIKTKLEQAQSAYAITKKNLEEGTLYAPFDGIISKCMISTGENVLPGKPVFRLICVDDIKIRFSVPEKEITDIRINDTASVSVQAFAN